MEGAGYLDAFSTFVSKVQLFTIFPNNISPHGF